MNTKDNRRSRQTVEDIVRAFYDILQKKKAVSKVTVREICEEAKVNRSTFYAHFQDVYDVLESVERHMAEDLTKAFLEKLDRDAGIGECFRSLFEFIGKYRQFYAIYLNETNKSGVLGIARELYGNRLGKDIWKELGFSSPREMEYQEAYAIAGVTAMVRLWLNNGCTETPDELCDIFFNHYSPERASLFRWERKDKHHPQSF